LPQDSEIQNITDEIAQLIDSTLYLLRFPWSGDFDWGVKPAFEDVFRRDFLAFSPT
jgi:hypothetical protein